MPEQLTTAGHEPHTHTTIMMYRNQWTENQAHNRQVNWPLKGTKVEKVTLMDFKTLRILYPNPQLELHASLFT